MIEYFDRYGSTDEPDNMGRWARTAVSIKVFYHNYKFKKRLIT
jgi:hypothetical protein